MAGPFIFIRQSRMQIAFEKIIEFDQYLDTQSVEV